MKRKLDELVECLGCGRTMKERSRMYSYACKNLDTPKPPKSAPKAAPKVIAKVVPKTKAPPIDEISSSSEEEVEEVPPRRRRDAPGPTAPGPEPPQPPQPNPLCLEQAHQEGPRAYLRRDYSARAERFAGLLANSLPR